MSGWLQGLWMIVGSLGAVAVGVALMGTRRPLTALLTSGVQGLGAVLAINVTGMFTGISLGLNELTMVCCVGLGLPGVLGLMVARLVLMV